MYTHRQISWDSSYFSWCCDVNQYLMGHLSTGTDHCDHRTHNIHITAVITYHSLTYLLTYLLAYLVTLGDLQACTLRAWWRCVRCPWSWPSSYSTSITDHRTCTTCRHGSVYSTTSIICIRRCPQTDLFRLDYRRFTLLIWRPNRSWTGSEEKYSDLT